MQDGALRKVADLPADTRHAVEDILGRSLSDSEGIAITIYKPAPTGKDREEASRRLLERVDKTAQRARGVSDKEIDSTIDEAVNRRRHDSE